MRVYVAGSSRELPRVRWAMDEIRAIGGTITEDWASKVERQLADGMTDADLSEHVRSEAVEACLNGVRAADVFWLLAPPDTAPSRGAWVELGYALGLRRAGAHLAIVASGGHARRSIFTSHEGVIVSRDESVIRGLRAYTDGIGGRP